jgi:hypothetical protein
MSDDTPLCLIGRIPFVDGVTRDVYEDPDGRQWVAGYDGERVYGVWVAPADEPVVVEGRSAQMRSPISTGIPPRPGSRVVPPPQG